MSQKQPSLTPCGCPDYIENLGQRFNASIYGYPFFMYEGKVYIAPIHSGHKKYAPVLAEQIGIDASELVVDVRHRHTTGRIYPKMMEFGGKTIVTVWCDYEKSADTFRKIREAVASYYSITWDEILFVNRRGVMSVK